MKKVHLFLSVLVLLASAFTCFAQTEKPSPQTSPQKDKAMSASQNPQDAAIIANERKVLDALKAKDTAAFSSLVAEDSWSLEGAGLLSRADYIKVIPEITITEYTFTDPKVIWLNKDVALLTYKSGVKGSFRGQEFPPNAAAYQTTIWVNRNGKWTAVFHQMTPARSQ